MEILSAKLVARLTLAIFVAVFSANALAQRGARPAEIREVYRPERDRPTDDAYLERQYVQSGLNQIALDAGETHKNLQSVYPEKAHAWLESLSAEQFMAHVNALDAEELALIGIEKQPSLQTEEEARISAQNRPALIAEYRHKYRDYIDAKIEVSMRAYVADRPAEAIQELMEYARAKGENQSDAARISISVIEQWLKSVKAEHVALLQKFPLFNAPGSEHDPRRSVTEITDTVAEDIDAHEHEYARAALADYIDNNPRLSGLGLENWRFRADNIPHLWSVLKRLEDPLPGGEPEVVFFLDRAVANAPIAEMSSAWTENSRAEPRILTHADIDLFLSEFRGRTVMLVGHIEHRQFVQERGGGQAPLTMDIATLIEAAARQGVFLVPIGCNSAIEGAYFGFTRPILSNEVADLLKAVPSGPLSVGDLLASFSAIGSISVDAANFSEYLEVTVHKPVAEGEESSSAVIVTRIPSASFSGNASSFTAYQTEWETTHRPLLDKGWLAAWRSFYRDSPILTLLLTGLVICFVPWGWDWLRTRVIRRRNLISRRERNAINSVMCLGFVFIVASVLRLLVEYGWPILVTIVVVVVFSMAAATVQTLLGGIFGSNTEKVKEKE